MKKLIALLAILAITSNGSGNIFTNTKIDTKIKISQKFLQNENLSDWSDNGYDFKIAKENYVLNLNPLPSNITDQIQNDEKNNQKSFSEDSLALKYLNEEQRKNFFELKIIKFKILKEKLLNGEIKMTNILEQKYLLTINK